MCWWWLPSPAALIPVGYKQEGRKEATNNNCNSMLPSSRSPSRWSFQHQRFPGYTMTTSRSIHASDAAKVNTSTITGVIHSCTAFGRLGSCVHVGSQRWGYALTANDNKAESPSVPQGWQWCQMCFPPSYWKFVSLTWSKLTAELVLQARIHRSSYSAHMLSTSCADRYSNAIEKQHYFYWWGTSWASEESSQKTCRESFKGLNVL